MLRILGLLEYLLMVRDIDLVQLTINLALVPMDVITGEIWPLLGLMRPKALV